jgi:hypothetical protein
MICPGVPFVDTGAANLESVVKSIWATEAPYMNDSEEFLAGQKVLSEASLRFTFRVPAEHRPLVDLVSKAISDAVGLDVYCSCFSREPDHLGQWRGYGDNGRGCAIGYDLLEMQKKINGVGFWTVYGNQNNGTSQRTVSDLLFKTLTDILVSQMPKQEDLKQAYYEAVSLQLGKLLPAVFLIFKDWSFRDEFEYRVVYSDIIAPLHLEDRCFRAAGAAIIPFVKLSFHKNEQAPIREIRLGPAAQSRFNLHSLKALLEQSNLRGVTASTSQIPFVP